MPKHMAFLSRTSPTICLGPPLPVYTIVYGASEKRNRSAALASKLVRLDCFSIVSDVWMFLVSLGYWFCRLPHPPHPPKKMVFGL